jgi:hypothetical protein
MQLAYPMISEHTIEEQFGGDNRPIPSTNNRLRKNNDLHGLHEEVG